MLQIARMLLFLYRLLMKEKSPISKYIHDAKEFLYSRFRQFLWRRIPFLPIKIHTE